MTDSTVRVLFLGDSIGARKAAADMDKAFSSSLKSVEGSAKSASSAVVSGFQTAAKAVAITGAVISGAIVGGLIGATAEAISFDKAMRNVNSIAGLMPAKFAKLEKSVLALSKSTGQGPTTLAKGLYDIVSSGFKADQALIILKQSAIAATAGMTDTATASNAIVGALNAWHLPATQAKNVASDLFETVKQGVLSFPQLAQNFGDLSGLAPTLGVSLQEVTGAFAALTLHGGSVSEMSTRVHAVMNELVKPTKATAAALKGMGYESATAAIKGEGFVGTLQKLYQATGGNLTVLAKLFPNTRALAGVLGLTGKNAETAAKFVDRQNKAYKDGTEATKAFLEQQKSIAVQWQLSKSAIEAAAVPLGAVFFPALIKVLNEGAKFAAFLTKLDAKKTITAKLEFAWQSVKDIGKHLWGQLSDAITGDSTQRRIVVPGTSITFDQHDTGLARRFWDWFTTSAIGTDKHGIQIGPQLLIVNHNDPTLRDQFVKMVQGINWAPVGAAIGVGIAASFGTLTSAFDKIGAAATAWANTHSGQLANVGALIALKVVATLLDPGFWVAHWQLIGGIILSVIPAGKFAAIGGKAAELMFGLFGKTVGRLILTGLEKLPFGEMTSKLVGGLGGVFVDVSVGLVKYSLLIVDALIRGLSKGFGKLGPLVRLLLNTGLVSAIGGVIGAAVSAAANVAGQIVSAITKLPGLGSRLGNATRAGIVAIPGAVAGAITGLASIGASIVTSIVGGIAGLGAAMLHAIESEISGIHVPKPHVSIGHVGAGPISIPYPTGIHFAEGGTISHPMLATVGEDAPRYPEFIIPTNPKYAGRARGLLSGAANALGIPGFAAGAGTVGSSISSTMPKVKHPKGSPNRKAKPVPGGGQITPPSGKEFNAIAAAANAALARVTQAALDVDNAGTLYDQTSRGYDLTRENFLLDVLDDPSDPTNTATHQERNEPDITQRVNELTDLQGMKAHLIELMNAQEQAVKDAVSKLQGLIKKLLDDIDDLRVQIEAQVALAKAFRAEQTAHTQTANQYRADAASDKQKAENTRALIATETAKPKPNKAKLKAWHLEASRLGADAKDATEHAHGEDGAAKASGHKADAADKQIGRLQTMVKNRADSISNYRTAISDQQSSLLPGGIPNNIVNAQLDIIDLQNQASDVTGTKGTLAAVITPATPASATASADDAARLAALEAQLAQYRLALGIQTVQQSVLGGFVGSFAKGSLYIPDTGFALVHRGESIATADQTAARAGGASDSTPIQVNVIVPDSMAFLRDTIRVEIEGATSRISTNVGISSDVRRRSNGY